MFGSKIKIDKELLNKIKKYSSLAGYTTPEEFVHHVLEKEISKLEEGGDSDEDIKNKLKGLGYIA